MGIVADVVTVMMYASPLSIMHTVITTKSVEYMPLTLSLNVFSNALAWTGLKTCSNTKLDYLDFHGLHFVTLQFFLFSAYAAYVRDVYVLVWFLCHDEVKDIFPLTVLKSLILSLSQIPNALGLLLAISQLIVYARYSRAGLKAKSESRQQLVDFSGEDTF